MVETKSKIKQTYFKTCLIKYCKLTKQLKNLFKVKTSIQKIN